MVLLNMMFRYVITVILMVISSYCSQAQIADYTRYFTQEALRLDFTLSLGKATQNVQFSFKQFLKETQYNGNYFNLIDIDELGNYQIAISKLSGDILYSKGFSSLYNEWLKTDLSKKKTRLFKHSISIPYPKSKVILSIRHRDSTNQFATLWQQAFNPKNKNIKQAPTSSVQVTKLWGKRRPINAIDIAIIADGYQQDEMVDFIKDASRLMEEVFKTYPYSAYKYNFNISLIELPYDETLDIHKNKSNWTSLNTFRIKRYLSTEHYWKIKDILSNIAHDHIVILNKSDLYGGAGIYNHYTMATANHPSAGSVIVHELGHSIFGLADEYVDSNLAFRNYYSLNTEPWEPNITTLVNFKNKWNEYPIIDSFPFPTPPLKKYEKHIGFFMGAGYRSQGIYRPYQSCIMRGIATKAFCPVCTKYIIKRIQFATGMKIKDE